MFAVMQIHVSQLFSKGEEPKMVHIILNKCTCHKLYGRITLDNEYIMSTQTSNDILPHDYQTIKTGIKQFPQSQCKAGESPKSASRVS